MANRLLFLYTVTLLVTAFKPDLIRGSVTLMLATIVVGLICTIYDLTDLTYRENKR